MAIACTSPVRAKQGECFVVFVGAVKAADSLVRRSSSFLRRPCSSIALSPKGMLAHALSPLVVVLVVLIIVVGLGIPCCLDCVVRFDGLLSVGTCSHACFCFGGSGFCVVLFALSSCVGSCDSGNIWIADRCSQSNARWKFLGLVRVFLGAPPPHLCVSRFWFTRSA